MKSVKGFVVMTASEEGGMWHVQCWYPTWDDAVEAFVRSSRFHYATALTTGTVDFVEDPVADSYLDVHYNRKGKNGDNPAPYESAHGLPNI